MLSASTRTLVASCLFACIFTGFSFRLVELQVTQHEEYVAEAAKKHGMSQTIYARRGAILDSSGQPLALNEPVRMIWADGSLIKDREAIAHFLAGPLEMPEPALLALLSREHWSAKEQKNVPDRYIVLKHRVAESVVTSLTQKINETIAKAQEQKKGEPLDPEVKRLANAGLRAITPQQDSVRIYPNGETLCHVIGMIDNENTGIDGVEKTMDADLRGHDGLRFTERDRAGKELVPYRGEERPARDGNNVRMTIDLALQDIVETELDAAVKQYHPKTAVAIMMRPQTGEILALANRPAFDLNHVDKSEMAARRNRAITDQVEPGSTFKIVTVSAALQSHLVHLDTMIPVENGCFQFMGRTLRDTHPNSELSVFNILVFSSNIGAAKLGIQLGDQRLYQAVRGFGFGERTGVQLPGEIPGVVHPVYQWSKLSISRIPMGQEVCVTPLQMTTAMCAIANGGNLMMPQIVHDVVDADGNSVTAFPPVTVRRVISPAVADQMREALIGVLSKKGTGKAIRVPGFIVAGKTGTAQKAGENGAGYQKDKYVVSFVGFLPAENPQFVCMVMIDEAVVEKHLNYGGTVAGPIFAKISERAARHLGMTPSPEVLAEQMKANPQMEHSDD